MLKRVILSAIVGIVVILACLLVGALLVALKVDIAVTLGNFLKTWATVIGVIAGIWHFFTGETL